MLDVCWTSRPNWAWESQLGLAVRMQDAGVSGADTDNGEDTWLFDIPKSLKHHSGPRPNMNLNIDSINNWIHIQFLVKVYSSSILFSFLIGAKMFITNKFMFRLNGTSGRLFIFRID